MNTPHEPNHTELIMLIDEAATIPPTRPGWHERAARRLRHARQALRSVNLPAGFRDPGNWLAGFGVAVGVTVVGFALWVVWLLLSGLVGGIRAAADGLGDVGHWITHGPITHAISDPVRAYLDAHTGGLPATGRDLWILWLVTTTALFVAAATGSTYGRIGWALVGVLTATTVWHGTTPAAARPTAAAVTAAVWLVLSLPAYAGVFYRSVSRAPLVHLNHTCKPQPEPAAEPA